MQHLHHNCNGQELIFLKKGNGKFVSTSISIFSGPLNRNFFILDKTLEGTTNGKKKKKGYCGLLKCPNTDTLASCRIYVYILLNL